MQDPGNRTPRSVLPADLYQEGFCKNAILSELLLQPQPGTAFVLPDDLRWRLLCQNRSHLPLCFPFRYVHLGLAKLTHRSVLPAHTFSLPRHPHCMSLESAVAEITRPSGSRGIGMPKKAQFTIAAHLLSRLRN